ncbi:outer membrane beta-barrel protein [uncultured Imperialibacter sp.]|uniref:outer membrane beta-barrel protein n=1 Tax=uncultured Imperialibacter sp. TaxID=1672639 RepID=UPI0030DD3B9A|tara:strand:- start:563 stop:1699 length:1137 start_codon:yes stop_codon:yes gene_type:complete
MSQSLKPILALLLLALPYMLTAQKEAYLKTKDILYYGAIHDLEKPDPNKVTFEFNNGNKKDFTPDEALEFGLPDGRKWVSKEYEGKKQFFEELENGKVALLLQEQGKSKSYLLEKGEEIIALGEDNGDENYFKDVLAAQLEDCYLTEKTIGLAKYKSANLKYFISQYNDCVHKPFPKFRIGPVVGVRIYQNIIESKFFPQVPEEMVTMSLGAIVEIPISYSPQILLVTQPMVAYHSFTATNNNYSPEDATTSYNTHYLKHTDLDIPIMLKYRFANYKFSPYIQAGPALQLGISTKAYSLSDKVKLQNGQFELIAEDVYVDSGALANKYLGVSGGAGVEIPINSYITSVVGVNYSIYTADVDTGSNRKTYPEFFVAVTF